MAPPDYDDTGESPFDDGRNEPWDDSLFDNGELSGADSTENRRAFSRRVHDLIANPERLTIKDIQLFLANFSPSNISVGARVTIGRCWFDDYAEELEQPTSCALTYCFNEANNTLFHQLVLNVSGVHFEGEVAIDQTKYDEITEYLNTNSSGPGQYDLRYPFLILEPKSTLTFDGALLEGKSLRFSGTHIMGEKIEYGTSDLRSSIVTCRSLEDSHREYTTEPGKYLIVLNDDHGRFIDSSIITPEDKASKVKFLNPEQTNGSFSGEISTDEDGNLRFENYATDKRVVLSLTEKLR